MTARVTPESYRADIEAGKAWLRANGIDGRVTSEVELEGEGSAIVTRFDDWPPTWDEDLDRPVTIVERVQLRTPPPQSIVEGLR